MHKYKPTYIMKKSSGGYSGKMYINNYNNVGIYLDSPNHTSNLQTRAKSW